MLQLVKLVTQVGTVPLWEKLDVPEGRLFLPRAVPLWEKLDVPEGRLFLPRANKTLRIRSKGTSYTLTIKTPTRKNTQEGCEEESQSQRFEYELVIKENAIENYKDYIVKYLPELKDPDTWSRLHNTLTIKNNRKQISVYRNNVNFEMVFDDVEYNGLKDTVKKEYQIEMELKSDYPHRVNLKLLSEYLESTVPELKPTHESKYKRGLILTS